VIRNSKKIWFQPDKCERETDTSRVIVGGGAARRRYLPYGSSTDPVNHPGQVETIAGSRFPGGGRPESCKNTHDEYVLNVESGTRTPPTKCKKYKSKKVQSRKGSGRFSRFLEEILICDVRVESVRFETFLRVKNGCRSGASVRTINGVILIQKQFYLNILSMIYSSYR
jgi:hypothetical protein